MLKCVNTRDGWRGVKMADNEKDKRVVIEDVYEMEQEENIFCAKRVLVDSVYKQANLEGIAVTYAQTQDILNNVNIDTLTPKDISKVCCLRDGWHYLLDNINKDLDLGFLQNIHELIARFDVDYRYLGQFRTEDVLISGTNWRPEIKSAEQLHVELMNELDNPNETDKAIKTGLWIMRSQPFKDGNKRVGTFAANKLLIESGRGLFNVPVEYDGTFKQLLVNYYESNNSDEICEWIRDNCLLGVNKLSNDEQDGKTGKSGKTSR